MDHIIQFAVSVDDDRIKELAEASAAKELIKQYKCDEYHLGFGNPRWKSAISDAIVNKLVAEIKETGMDEVANEVADKLFRSSKFREKVAGELAERGK